MVLPLLLYTIEHCDGISCANKLQSVACLLKDSYLVAWLQHTCNHVTQFQLGN